MLTDKQLLNVLKTEYATRIKNDTNQWENTAREQQKLPAGEWKIWLIMAGRGFGKTRAAAEAVRKLVLEKRFRRIALIGDSIKEVQQVMVEGESGLLTISQESDGMVYNKSLKRLIWPNGAIATMYGAERSEQLRGPQFDFAWIDEIAKFKSPESVFNQINLALRIGKSPKMIITTTPRSIQLLRDLTSRSDVHVTRGSSIDNQSNLSDNFLQQLEYMKGTSLEAQEVYGEIVEDHSDALWTFEDIKNCYKMPQCDFIKVIVSVDPSVSGKEEHDETGIIVCGLDEVGEVYIINDLSRCTTPEEWLTTVVDAYEKYKANYVLFEANQGGDLIKTLLHGKNPDIKTKSVYAKVSKKARALPVSLLYAKKKVHHLSQFQKLEAQMTGFMSVKKSPDRVDALVLGVQDLLLDPAKIQTSYWNIPIGDGERGE